VVVWFASPPSPVSSTPTHPFALVVLPPLWSSTVTTTCHVVAAAMSTSSPTPPADGAPSHLCARDEFSTEGASDAAIKKPRRLWRPTGASDRNDVMCVKVVFNASAYVTSGRKRVGLLQQAVDTFNIQPNAPFIKDPKHLADRFKLLTDQYERENKVREAQSGKEDKLKLSELDELLADALRAKDKWLEAKEGREEAKDVKEARLRQQGAQARDAMLRRRQATSECETGDGEEPKRGADSGVGGDAGSTAGWPSGSRKRFRAPDDANDDELLSLLRDSQKRKHDLDERRLARETRRMQHERDLHDEAHAKNEHEASAAAAAAAAAAAQQTATMSLLTELARSIARRK